jgi:hypothetical protein
MQSQYLMAYCIPQAHGGIIFGTAPFTSDLVVRYFVEWLWFEDDLPFITEIQCWCLAKWWTCK